MRSRKGTNCARARAPSDGRRGGQRHTVAAVAWVLTPGRTEARVRLCALCFPNRLPLPLPLTLPLPTSPSPVPSPSPHPSPLPPSISLHSHAHQHIGGSKGALEPRARGHAQLGLHEAQRLAKLLLCRVAVGRVAQPAAPRSDCGRSASAGAARVEVAQRAGRAAR
eukprot:1472138-Prymnesium_polylepis.1